MHKITINNLTGYKLVFFLWTFLLSFQAKAQFPFFESFKNSTAPSTQFGGSPTAFLTAGAGLKDNYNDAEGEGYLRLTNYKEDQKGFVWWDQLAFPSGNGMTISFEYYSFGGNYPGTRAADGIAFVLFDATASPITPGAYGSGLGYAQNTSSNPKQNGFSKGYLGIGLDESGNFSTTSDGKTGGVSLEYDRITLRGAGTGLTGYPYLTSIQTTSLPGGFFVKGNIRDVTVSSDLNGFRKAEIVLTPRPTGGFFINVYITHNKIKTLVINNYAYTTPPPPSLKMAITSSTGALTSYHEIRNLQITTDLTTLLNPIANPDAFSGPAGQIAISSDITANDNGAVNKFGTVNKQTIDLDPSIPGIQTTTTIAEKGTFTYDSVTGKVTFTPVDNKVITPVTIYYNFNDSYGKTSNTSTITYTPTCTTIADNTITLQSLPFFCNNDSGNGVMIMGSNLDASSVNYLWESSTDNITFKSTDGITRNYAPNPFNVTTYFRRKVTSGTCTSISNVVSIISKSSIEQPILNNVIQPTCTNAKGSFTIINYDPLFTYEILPNTGVVQNGETINAPAGNYTVVAKVENCISSTSLPIQISTQSSLPPVPTISTIIQPTCSKVMGSLTITNYNIAYTYEMNPAAGTTIIGNQVTAPEGNYTLVAKSGTCVSSEATISINAQPETPATPILSAITQPTCTNQIGRFTITNYNPAYTYEMSPPTGTIIGNQITVSSGTYTIAAKSGSCRSIISAYAKINSLPIKDADVVTTESICSGQTYTWPANGTTYSTSQNALKIVNDGCTADQVLNLTVGSKPADVVTTESICSGTIFHWDVTGMDYSSSGTYTKTNDGCTANQVLKLTIKNKPADITTNETRCSGETFHWNVTGLDYNATGTYTKNNDGCTADQILNLTITPKPADIIETITYCEGEFHYSLHKDINDGCTADIVYEYVMIPKPANIVTTESICSGQTYTWPANGITYSTSQTGLKITNDGCTADQVLNLTVGSKPADIVTSESICSEQTFKWPANGITYSTSQTGLKITNDGCTADQVLNLTVTPKPADIVTTESICSGQTFTWPANGITYSTSQNALKIVNDGCTADQVLNLTVGSKPADIVTTESICSGQTFTWPANGITYSTSQTGLKITNDGCTADQVLNLTVGSKPADIVTAESICSGQTYTWPANGIIYSTSQTGLKITNDECTADQVLNLTVDF
ncbi:hypothetical protein RB618_05920, partial [Flavobacterium sp. LHD-85]|nr:hypothetical protein [Flavobacterium sp. LHD-85]